MLSVSKSRFSCSSQRMSMANKMSSLESWEN
jgi:hypothetical protein